MNLELLVLFSQYDEMWLFRSGLVVLVYCALCAYMGARFFGFIRFFFPGFKALVFWPLAALCAFSFVLIMLFRLDRFFLLRQAAYYYIAVFAYLLLTLPVFDLLRLVLRLVRRNVPGPGFGVGAVGGAVGVGAALCISLLIIVCGAIHARNIHTVRYSLSIPPKAAGQSRDQLRIVLISDLHIGGTVGRAWISRIVDKVNQAEPDLVCIAGDIFDGSLDIVEDLAGTASELRRIRAPLGVYACLGNHDVDRVRVSVNGIFAAAAGITAFLKEANITLLEDEAALVRPGLYVAGRRDARPIGMSRSRLEAAELLAPLDRENVIIALDHQPTQFPLLEEAGADLLFCGHSHRGQLFPANLVTRAIFKKAGGTHYGYWRGKTMQAVVTSGAGLWGPPVRVGTNSEVAVIDLTFEEADTR
jgi:predicted MPP superfamily phosphohydrolase